MNASLLSDYASRLRFLLPFWLLFYSLSPNCSLSFHFYIYIHIYMLHSLFSFCLAIVCILSHFRQFFKNSIIHAWNDGATVEHDEHRLLVNTSHDDNCLPQIQQRQKRWMEQIEKSLC